MGLVDNKGSVYGLTSANAYAIALICPIDDSYSVLARVVNNHAANDVHWKVSAWRVPIISRVDSGRERHPTTIPSDATVIQAEQAVGTSGAVQEVNADDTDDYTHIAIEFKSVVSDTHSDDVDVEIWGRLEVA